MDDVVKQAMVDEAGVVAMLSSKTNGATLTLLPGLNRILERL